VARPGGLVAKEIAKVRTEPTTPVSIIEPTP